MDVGFGIQDRAIRRTDLSLYVVHAIQDSGFNVQELFTQRLVNRPAIEVVVAELIAHLFEHCYSRSKLLREEGVKSFTIPRTKVSGTRRTGRVIRLLAVGFIVIFVVRPFFVSFRIVAKARRNWHIYRMAGLFEVEEEVVLSLMKDVGGQHKTVRHGSEKMQVLVERERGSANLC